MAAKDNPGVLALGARAEHGYAQEHLHPAVGDAASDVRWGLGWAALGVLAFSFTFPATVLALRSLDPYVVGAGRSSSPPWWRACAWPRSGPRGRDATNGPA